MRLVIETGTRHEQVYIEADPSEAQALLQHTKAYRTQGIISAMIRQAYEYQQMVVYLDSVQQLPYDWKTTRPEDATTSDRLLGLPLRVSK